MTNFNETRNVSEEMKQAFSVTKNVPVPVKLKKRSGRKNIYPFATMEVNDSFFVPCEKSQEQKIRSIYYSARHYKMGLETPVDFQILYIPEEKGIRVWRIL